MRTCVAHWDKMRMAVEDRGLSHLVASSTQESAERTIRELECAVAGDCPDVVDFDPLVSLNWHFAIVVLERRGLCVFADRGSEKDGMPENKDEKGFNHVCPLCLIRLDYDLHNTPTGRCGDSQCNVLLKPGDPVWDDNLLRLSADEMLAQCQRAKLTQVH